ncbi:MAG: M2 family metallopeptidase [bacterium]
MKRVFLLAGLLMVTSLSITSCASSTKNTQKIPVTEQAQQFLDSYTDQYLQLYAADEMTQWESNIHIEAEDTTRSARAKEAAEALAVFTGSTTNIETARKYLDHADELTSIQVRQFEVILRLAANNPATVPDLVRQRIAAETAQNEVLYGFDFRIDGKPVSTNEIDDILKFERNNLDRRHKAWETSKQVGVAIKPGLVDLVRLRNATVQALGYDNYFQYMVSEYGMTPEELTGMVDRFNQELRPLYRELHTWARYTLAERFGQPVPDQLPADWLPNRWGQDWSPLITVEGMDLDQALADSSAEFVVQTAEKFYVSLGYPKLPESFWELSSLYPLPTDAPYKKNNHASAWHIDLDNDVRSLMSVIPNAEWWETAHHELGHIYYYLAYSNPNVPPLLRRGANRAYHEATGSLSGLASMQAPYLEHVGLIDSSARVDPIQPLLREALSGVVFIPWSSGVMTHYEKDLYSEPLSPDEYNARWWKYKTLYQGIVPPEGTRGEEYCDAGSKTHITDDPAAYYDYAISYILLYQLHVYIAQNILQEDPHATDYYGRKDVGEFLWSILDKGATGDWRSMLIEKTGSELSAKAMLDYFQPLYDWLKVQNEGRIATLPGLGE